MNLNEVKTNISASLLEDNAKQTLLGLIGNATPNLAHFIDIAFASHGLSKIEQTCKYQVIMEGYKALRELDSGQEQSTIKFFESAMQPDWDYGRDAIYIAMDIREVLAKNPGRFERAHEALSHYEWQVFSLLPEQELKNIISSDLLFFAWHYDVLVEFRKAYILNEPSYDFGLWVEQFVPLLENNEEQLGQAPIVMDDKEQKSTIRNWLKDYDRTINKPIADRGPYDQIQYTNTSKNAQKLSREERGALMHILALYDWLKEPVVSEEEASSLGLGVPALPSESRSVKIQPQESATLPSESRKGINFASQTSSQTRMPLPSRPPEKKSLSPLPTPPKEFVKPIGGGTQSGVMNIQSLLNRNTDKLVAKSQGLSLESKDLSAKVEVGSGGVGEDSLSKAKNMLLEERKKSEQEAQDKLDALKNKHL